LPCGEKAAAITPDTTAFTYSVFRTISEVSTALWDNLLPEEHLFLSRDYLKSLEASTGDEVQYRYLVIFQHKVPAGIGFFQLIHFRGSNVENDGAKAPPSLLAYAGRLFRRIVVATVNRISLNLLVGGNTFVTGEYGFYFVPSLKKHENLSLIIKNGIEKIIEESPIGISGILLKDYYEEHKVQLRGLKQDGFLEFRVNPNMLLHLKPSWKTFEDYLGDMASKYRTRMRKAMKRAESLTIRELTAEELQAKLPEVSSLYDEVVDDAAFKLAKLNVECIVRLKKELGDRFGVVGFFSNEQMVSFISWYQHEDDLVAGYLGMRRSLNHKHDLYLNVLLQLAKKGITRGLKRVVYGRTAMEIKSSVGAVPQAMYLYVKHRTPVINFIIRQVIRYLSKEEKWVMRSPFKETVCFKN